MAKGNWRIYVATDLEGASGVFRFAQTRDTASPLYAQAMEYLMGDIAALVRGLREAGAARIVVADGHGRGDNFIPHLMEPGATYVTGGPRRLTEGLDRTFHGVVLLGYHAMKGTADGVLNHTHRSTTEMRYWFNDRESGELAMAALLAGGLEVPVIMVTGDTATCREAREFLGRSVITVATKRGIGREAAELYPLQETRAAIFEGAGKAVEAISSCRPYKLPAPIRCRREWIEHTDRPSETRIVVREASVRDVKKIVDF